MKKYKIIFLIIGVIMFFIVLSILFVVGKNGVGRLVDKLGITNDRYEIFIDKKFTFDTYIYWHGETVNGTNDNRMLFYHLSKVSDMPPLYGYNGFEVKYKTITYDKIKIWKMFPYSKYNYFINIKSIGENMVIEWRIHNWYDPDIVQGSDTIKTE
ncbi:MAG: hypothetical protein LBL79_09720 [Prevotella sp.]|jgi:hypothetical protein|nr:hypothetical protein [Prevotella sp.]